MKSNSKSPYNCSSDPNRQVIVVSALGKRTSDDDKVTDLLYLIYATFSIMLIGHPLERFVIVSFK